MKLKLGVDALHLKESHENAIVDEEVFAIRIFMYSDDA